MAEPGVPPEAARELLRHTLATLVYRCAKTLRGAPDGFGEFRTSEAVRTPAEILAHVSDLLDWGLSIARGQQTWNDSSPRGWAQETRRFFGAAAELDRFLASDQPLAASPQRLFQGPIADALTHSGQLAMLRRLAGDPVRAENYLVADISAGRVGPDQPAPRREFD